MRVIHQTDIVDYNEAIRDVGHHIKNDDSDRPFSGVLCLLSPSVDDMEMSNVYGIDVDDLDDLINFGDIDAILQLMQHKRPRDYSLQQSKVKFQIDNGSDTTTAHVSSIVTNYDAYTPHKRPTLISVTSH